MNKMSIIPYSFQHLLMSIWAVPEKFILFKTHLNLESSKYIYKVRHFLKRLFYIYTFPLVTKLLSFGVYLFFTFWPVSSPLSPPNPSPHSLFFYSQSSPQPFLFSKGQVSSEYQQSRTYQVAVRLSTFLHIKTLQGSPYEEWIS